MSNESSKELAREIAMQDYGNTAYHRAQFEKDFNVFLTTKKMISRFIRTGVVNEKLLINNVVTALNLFGTKQQCHLP